MAKSKIEEQLESIQRELRILQTMWYALQDKLAVAPTVKVAALEWATKVGGPAEDILANAKKGVAFLEGKEAGDGPDAENR